MKKANQVLKCLSDQLVIDIKGLGLGSQGIESLLAGLYKGEN